MRVKRQRDVDLAAGREEWLTSRPTRTHSSRLPLRGSCCVPVASNVIPQNMHIDPLSWWQSEIGGIAPVGHALRPKFKDNWARFHSLPESKRYAEDESEYVELLQRHQAVGDEIFSAGETIYIFRSHAYEKKLRGKQKHQIVGRLLRESVTRLPVNPGLIEENDDDHYCVRALVTKWKPDFFSSLIYQIADFKESGVTIVSPATKAIFCPYDGGMDIFTYSQKHTALEAKFSTWLSSRSDKL